MTAAGARGGRQYIPRPSTAFRVPSPWRDLASSERVFDVRAVRARLADIPPARRVVTEELGLRAAAVLVPLFEEHDETRVVLTRRTDTLPTHQGDIAFPGGKVDVNVDIDAPAAALREAEEEIALRPSSVEIVAELDHFPSVVGGFAMAPFVGIVDGRPHLVPAPGEVDRVFDVALSELLDPETHHLEQWGELTLHFFELEDETVWGATARILALLLGHLTGLAGA